MLCLRGHQLVNGDPIFLPNKKPPHHEDGRVLKDELETKKHMNYVFN